MRETPHFVLVHGAGHGAWCWYKIRSLMETSGHLVTCLDLKGAGIDPSDPNTIFTLEDYDQPLANFLSNLPQNEKVQIYTCYICNQDLLIGIFACLVGNFGGTQRGRSQPDERNTQVPSQNSHGHLRRSQHVKAWFLHRSRYQRCNISSSS